MPDRTQRGCAGGDGGAVPRGGRCWRVAASLQPGEQRGGGGIQAAPVRPGPLSAAFTADPVPPSHGTATPWLSPATSLHHWLRPACQAVPVPRPASHPACSLFPPAPPRRRWTAWRPPCWPTTAASTGWSTVPVPTLIRARWTRWRATPTPGRRRCSEWAAQRGHGEPLSPLHSAQQAACSLSSEHRKDPPWTFWARRRLNVLAPMRLTRLLAPAMAERGARDEG